MIKSAMLEILQLTAIIMVIAFVTTCAANETKLEYDSIWPGVGHNNLKTILDVNFNSSFCTGLLTYSGKTCDYANINKTIRFMGRYPSYLEARITNAKELLYYPSCIPWTFVNNSAFFITLPSLRMDEHCSTWLTLSNSYAYLLAFGIHDASIINSTIVTIHLKKQRDFKLQNSRVENIELLEWEGYVAEVLFSNISKISHIKSSQALFIQHSFIGSIATDALIITQGHLMFNNTNIKTIATNGVNVTSGKLSLFNVTIENLDEDAIRVDALTEVTLKNVTILNGDFPTFFFPTIEHVTLENVTIAGEVVRHVSKWIKEHDNTNIVKENETDFCFTENSTLTCDFSGFVQEEFNMDIITEMHSSLIIRSANYMKLSYSICQLNNITIINSIMSFIIISNFSSNICEANLLLKNSKVINLEASAIQNIELIDSSTTFLNLENISNFKFLNSTFVTIGSLTTNANSSGFISNSLIGEIDNAGIKGRLQIHESFINNIKDITITNPEGTSKFSKVEINTLNYVGLTLKAGHLDMLDVRFTHLMPRAVYLVANATISIHGDSYIPLSGRRFISLVNESQANISTSQDDQFLTPDSYYTLRNTGDIKENYEIENILIDGAMISSPYCIALILLQIHCDFNLVTSAIKVNVQGMGGYYSSLILENIDFLQMDCSSISGIESKVYLLRTTDGIINCSFLRMRPASIWDIQKSSLAQFKTFITEFSMKHSNISQFEPNTYFSDMCNINIASSHVYLVDEVVCGYFDAISSEFEIVQEIVTSKFQFYDGKIGIVKMTSITVEEETVNGNSTIKNTAINIIESRGITVIGDLHVVNCTIDYAEDMSFDVYGKLTLEDVDIKNGSSMIFNLRRGSYLQLINVKINGKKIALERNVVFLEHSNITNITIPNITTKESEVVEDLEPTTESTMNFKQTRRTTLLMTTNRTSSVNQYLQSDDNDDEDAGLAWLGAVLGFLIGSCCAGLVLYALLVLRPNTKLVIPTAIRWRARDEQLVPSDDEEMSERGIY